MGGQKCSVFMWLGCRKSVRLWEVKSAVFLCGWDVERVSAYGRSKVQCLYVAGI